MALPAHGANALALYRQLQLPMPEKIYDLSENVNVLGSPSSIKKLWPALLESVGSYPDMLAEPFRSKVASVHRVPNDFVVVGNGAAELLMAIAQFFREKHAIIVEPSFSEYKRTLLQQNVHVESIVVEDICLYKLPMQALKKAMDKGDVIYLCNPNNPTGVLTAREEIEELLAYGEKVGCAVVVDEAFMDWTDEKESVIDLTVRYANLFVLRSMTKMYALAGVRLGYLVSRHASNIYNYLPHWSVSGIAIAIGCQCLEESAFVQISGENSTKMRTAMSHFLMQHGCAVTASEANFLTFKLPMGWSVPEAYLYFLQHGIVLRHTENYIGLDGQWFRIGMKDEEAMNEFTKRFVEYENNLPSKTR
ncbi:pyridoxal phosphate-dependent aminotransferase [Lysinibacillus sp. 54212]|uniref:pyridoxal phosphate-dependent aminotransferase n=1 Tax=Lysinibacillus sp. 54212 TaxID=3119829 RepID=UPI002FCC74A3